MKIWYFSETAYPYLPPAETYDSVRVDLPNRHYDPEKGAALYDRFIDEWVLATEEGMEIMMNEHHQTPTCVDPAAPLVLAALARVTRKGRILILGNPIANRRQPVRVAEEMALADILSHGRIDVGFVRGVPFEISPANSNPVYMNERHWEALDLIVKCWTEHDGPFSHEGRYFHSRRINIWPRPFQTPHPPIWVSTTTPSGAARVGGRGYIQATFLTGFRVTPTVFASYRAGWRGAGRGDNVAVNRLAYCAFVYAGDTEAEARANAQKLLWHIAINKIAPQFVFPPGYATVAATAQRLRAGAGGPASTFPRIETVDQAIEAGIMFAGTPDQVYRQIANFYRRVGGFGHLLVIGQSGFLDHDSTERGIKLLAREVYPRLKAEFADDAISADPPPASSAAE